MGGIDWRAWLLLALVPAVHFAWRARRARASKGWPSVRGVLLEHAVRFADIPWYQDRDEGGKDPDLYEVRVKYAYEVEGRRYVSTRLRWDGSNRLRHSREIEDWIRSLAAGGPVEVFYDPKRPERAVLLKG